MPGGPCGEGIPHAIQRDLRNGEEAVPNADLQPEVGIASPNHCQAELFGCRHDALFGAPILSVDFEGHQAGEVHGPDVAQPIGAAEHVGADEDEVKTFGPIQNLAEGGTIPF